MPPIDETENSGSIDTVEQADDLLNSIESPDSGPIQDAPAQAPSDEWEITVGGKPLKAKRDQVIQWAQMGYDAPNKIRTLSQERETYQKKVSEFENRIKEYDSKYKEIDEYVRQNPQFWDHVTQSWQNKSQALQDSSNPLGSVVQQLQAQVQDLVQYKNQIEERQSQARTQQEDQEYMQTFEGIQKQYPDIDFSTPDMEGKSLEYKVLEHAQNEGIKNFKTAFLSYHHDELMKRAEGKAKENLIKEKQKNTKLGILGITPTPTKRVSSTDVRGKSYDNLAQEAMDELGLK